MSINLTVQIAGTGVVVGPDDFLVIAAPQQLTAEQADEWIDTLSKALADSPLAHRVFAVSNGLSVVKAEPKTKP